MMTEQGYNTIQAKDWTCAKCGTFVDNSGERKAQPMVTLKVDQMIENAHPAFKDRKIKGFEQVEQIDICHHCFAEALLR